MKKVLFTIVFICSTMVVLSTNMGELKGVFKPEMIQIFKKCLYIVEGAEVHQFSLPKLIPLKKYGRKGEGPGELKAVPMWFNSVYLSEGTLFIDGMDKIVYFSLTGDLLNERKKSSHVHRLVPFKHKYIGSNMTEIKDKVQYHTIVLYDQNLVMQKELYRQVFPAQSVAQTTEMIPDIINFSVYQDRLFIERSREGFLIDVFNLQGELQYQVKRDTKGRPVTEHHKQEAIDKFKQDPFIKQIGFEQFKRMTKFIFPDFFPPIGDIMVASNHIYVLTFNRQKGMRECLILTLRGELIKTVYLPLVEDAPLMAHVLGIKYYTIHDGKFYYLEENEDTENWVLNSHLIK